MHSYLGTSWNLAITWCSRRWLQSDQHLKCQGWRQCQAAAKVHWGSHSTGCLKDSFPIAQEPADTVLKWSTNSTHHLSTQVYLFQIYASTKFSQIQPDSTRFHWSFCSAFPKKTCEPHQLRQHLDHLFRDPVATPFANQSPSLLQEKPSPNRNKLINVNYI